MSITMTRTWGLWIAGLALAGLGSMSACLSDESEPAAETGGSGGSSGSTGGAEGGADTGGTGGGTAQGGSTSTGGTTPGTLCTAPIALPSTAPGITDFEAYDGGADLAVWSFALGGDASTGVFAGTFGYGDEADGFPETFEMVAGNDSTYGLSISDTLAEDYGGGLGLWLSECLDASAFSGISFWVRGNAPKGTAKISLWMSDATPHEDDGACAGPATECVQPFNDFTVSDTWTQVQLAWSKFVEGKAGGIDVVPDGSNIWQLQFDIGTIYAADPDTGEYVPTPAPYELVIDDLTFF